MLQLHGVIPVIFKGYALIIPELLLIVAALWALFSERLPGGNRGAAAIAAVLVLFSGAILGCTAMNTVLFGSKLVLTQDARFGGVVLCLLALIWLIWTAFAGSGRTGEATALVCFSLAGALLATQAGDLIILLLALELTSQPIYVLIGYRHKRAKGLEGALKYFLLSILTSLFLFYGASFVLGLAHSTSYGDLQNLPAEPLMVVALLFMLIGIFGKMSVAPFHFWAPDAYEGAEPWVVAFAATAPKIAGGFVLVRLMMVLYAQIAFLRWPVLIAAVLCMLLGSLAALTQKDLRRMLAYAGVANMGYMLLMVGIANPVYVAVGWLYALFFLATYGLPTMGILLIAASEGGKVSDLAGLSHRRPLAAACLAVFALSLIGIPPLVGFFGKFFIALVGIAGSLLWGVILMVLVSAISAFYYLRLIKAAFFDKPESAEAGAQADAGAQVEASAQAALPDGADAASEEQLFGRLLQESDEALALDAAEAGQEAEEAAVAPPSVRVSRGAEFAIVLCALLVFLAGPAAGFISAWLSNPPY
ncbi:MAG: NADH-quinone oxidoreductase subunit N [Coriobacteriia bacterium]|nr:NADH-quinone oxidoreductase subunit N [Coriobacteriia bacterium]